jgi:hypothetical protein
MKVSLSRDVPIPHHRLFTLDSTRDQQRQACGRTQSRGCMSPSRIHLAAQRYSFPNEHQGSVPHAQDDRGESSRVFCTCPHIFLIDVLHLQATASDSVETFLEAAPKRTKSINTRIEQLNWAKQLMKDQRIYMMRGRADSKHHPRIKTNRTLVECEPFFWEDDLREMTLLFTPQDKPAHEIDHACDRKALHRQTSRACIKVSCERSSHPSARLRIGL